jgi:hypothetical protein
MSNYTILQRNILDSLESDSAKSEFLWASSRDDADRNLYRAERYAREVDRHFGDCDKSMIAAAVLGYKNQGLETSSERLEDLGDFILRRFRNYRFPQRSDPAQMRDRSNQSF